MRCPSKHNKKWPADFLPDRPFHSLQAVFDDKDPEIINTEVPLWFAISVSHEGASYYEHKEREDLAIFVLDLIRLSEALYLLLQFKLKRLETPHATVDFVSVSKSLEYTEFRHLSSEDIGNPLQVISNFVKSYHKSYARLELWHLFDGVRFYSGPLLATIYPYDTQNMWLLLFCVIETAYIMTSISYNDLDGYMVSPVTSP